MKAWRRSDSIRVFEGLRAIAPSAKSSATYYRSPASWQWFVVAVTLTCGVGFGLMVLVAISMRDVPFALIAATAQLFTFRASWRSRRLGMLRADDRGITEYRPVRNRFLRWKDIDHFTVEVRILPFKAVESRVLVVHTVDGQERALDTIVAPPKSGTSSWVDLAAAELNRRHTERRV